MIEKHQQLNPTFPVSHVLLKNSDIFQKLTQAGTSVHQFFTKAITFISNSALASGIVGNITAYDGSAWHDEVQNVFSSQKVQRNRTSLSW